MSTIRPTLTPLGKAILAVVLVVACACIGGGVFLIVKQETGIRAGATVANCARSNSARYGTDCTGTWVVGGSLVGGGGHVVVGPIDGAGSSDVGKTIDVSVSGDVAYARSLGLPIVLIGLGLVLAAFSGLALIKAGRWIRRRAPQDVA